MGKLLRFLVLACVVQAAGAQGLFKGFVPDENGTNLDDPQARKIAPIGGVNSASLIKDCPECPEVVVIPTGSFVMGSSEQEAKSAGMNSLQASRESPLHHVRVSSFAAGRYAVTKGEYEAFVRSSGYPNEQSEGCYLRKGDRWKKDSANNWRNPGFAQGDDHPVVCVSWNDAQAYIQWLNRISGKSYRLLSEAEREYATRGGTQTAFWWGDSVTTSQANYNGQDTHNGSLKGEYRQATMPVSSFSANPFGLYNVHGNVFEWTQDCWHENFTSAPTDGVAWMTGCTGNYRVVRGGSWVISSGYLRSAYRGQWSPESRFDYVGFRLARDL